MDLCAPVCWSWGQSTVVGESEHNIKDCTYHSRVGSEQPYRLRSPHKSSAEWTNLIKNFSYALITGASISRMIDSSFKNTRGLNIHKSNKQFTTIHPRLWQADYGRTVPPVIVYVSSTSTLSAIKVHQNMRESYRGKAFISGLSRSRTKTSCRNTVRVCLTTSTRCMISLHIE